MSDNLERLRKANEKADPFFDRMLARVAASRWTAPIVVGAIIAAFIIGAVLL